MTFIAAGAGSTGGLTAFAVSKFFRKKQTNEIRGEQNETARDGTQNRSKPNESSGNRVAG
jgi:hypothetical protein